MAGVSRNHAMRLFRRITGATIRQYVTQHRISHAQRLLASTDRKMTDIAGEAGFNSPTRFHAAFRRFVGQTPARYRRTLHRGRAAGGT